jgi:hypothetical protein
VYYFIYKTVNLIDGTFYVGKHCTSDIEDAYLGSGTLIRKRIREHGRENFKREILEFVDNSELLNAREKEIVNTELLKDPNCLNLITGGYGFDTDSVKLMQQRLGPEWLSKKSRSAMKTMGPEGLSAKSRKRHKTLGHDKLSELSKRANETMGVEGLSAKSKKGNETLGAEGRSNKIKKVAQTLGVEGRAARARKIAQNRKLNKLAAQKLLLTQ